MFSYFDYIFYRVCKAYSGTISRDPAGSAMSFVSLIQLFNILTFEFLFEIIIQHKAHISKILIVIIGILLLVFNYRRYIYKDDRSDKVLNEKWRTESQNLKIKNGILTILYIIISMSLGIGLAIYLGNKKY